MADILHDWVVQQSDHVLSRQRAQVDAAKLVVSLSLGVAAGLVGTALQVAPTAALDVASTVGLVLTAAASVGTVLFDRLQEADARWANRYARQRLWSADQATWLMRIVTYQAEEKNSRSVRAVLTAAGVQVAAASLTVLLAVLSLLLT